MKQIDSKIYLKELVENTERRFGSDTEYYPVYIEDKNGDVYPALFTCAQIEAAMHRASVNTEDMPEEDKSFFDWLF